MTLKLVSIAHKVLYDLTPYSSLTLPSTNFPSVYSLVKQYRHNIRVHECTFYQWDSGKYCPPQWLSSMDVCSNHQGSSKKWSVLGLTLQRNEKSLEMIDPWIILKASQGILECNLRWKPQNLTILLIPRDSNPLFPFRGLPSPTLASNFLPETQRIISFSLVLYFSK